ncbi:transposase DNA-binding-containing protein [Paraburkholderia humisilvae]|uniref:transposase DNA-binding-containing protein n=1 Tax=Paraburkholderia humisilvae TaxID=627669 RepID=UPI00406BA143
MQEYRSGRQAPEPAGSPAASIAQACGSRAETAAAYRFSRKTSWNGPTSWSRTGSARPSRCGHAT